MRLAADEIERLRAPLAEAYTLEQWDDESKGGIDPYEVDKFLDWLALGQR